MLAKQVSDEIVEEMRGVFGDQLTAIVLYGSVARGDDTPESDVDIALLLRLPMEQKKLDAMISFFSELGMKYDKVFSPIDIEQSMFDDWVDYLPFYRNIREEGIVLWKAG